MIALSAVVFGAAGIGTPVASAEEMTAAWSLSAGERPTNLQPHLGKNEVQELTVNATGGEFALVNPIALRHGEFPENAAGEPTYALFAYDAPASTVQAGLQKLFPEREVEVSGGPGGLHPYVISFPDQAIEQLVPSGEFPGAVGGTNLSGEVNLTELSAGGPDAEMVVYAQNVGDAGTSSPTTIVDSLPAGLTAVAIEGTESRDGVEGAVKCSLSSLACVVSERVPQEQRIEVRVSVALQSGASSGEENVATVSGGGTSPQTAGRTLEVNGTTKFGVEEFSSVTDERGEPVRQAGAHPYEMTTTLRFDTKATGQFALGATTLGGYIPVEDVKELEVGLPAGVVVNPTATPTLCTEAELGSLAAPCPESSQVGVVHLHLGEYAITNPVYNMVPPTGEPAELGFLVEGTTVAHVLPLIRTGSDSGISASVPGIPQVELDESALTLWGEPSDPRHDEQRGACQTPTTEETGKLCPTERTHKALLTLPTSCAGPLTTTVRADSWQEPNVFLDDRFSGDGAEALTGCARLGLSPSFTAAPDTAEADTPSGLTFDLKTPQEGLSAPEALAPPDLRTTTVTLPEGVAINPGQAAGLQACQPSQDALTTAAEKAENEEDTAAPSCPNASKVGTVEITTPLLDSKLYGNVYVLPSDPPDVQLLLAASVEGVNLKLVGDARLNEATGQITTTFANTPQLPFEELKLSFSGGAQAALTTPTNCGVYTTVSDFTPWSSPFASDTISEGGFAITSGPGGGACSSSPLPFSPLLTAGSTTDQAGGFTNFSMLLQRGDGQQRISGLQFKAPAGLTGELARVPLCTNAQAESNTCPEASKIGHTVVESGPGPYPLVVPEPGQEPAPIYLTESYGGAPFGLSIVVPLHVGPFVLPTQRVRAKIDVNPTTAALTITTNELPQIVAGVPTDLREVDAVIEKPEFMVNPTNCDPQEFSGTAYGTPPPGVGGPGTQAAISSHFQVGSCRSLEFKPKFTVSTSGRTSKQLGASLTARVSEPNAPQGTQADIAKVKVELPKVLPSRLTTLQKACTDAQFEANPAGCPSESKIGHAVVHTPLLPVALEGPAIFVSHGDEAFPSLTLVLQGDGVTIDLVGATKIKNGVTSTTFNAVPDQPFSTFELTLPEGKYSALAANSNLCALTKTVTVKKLQRKRVHGKLRNVTVKVKKTETEALVMPSEFVGQNGAVFTQSTKISVTGCSKGKPAKKTAKKPKGQGHK